MRHLHVSSLLVVVLGLLVILAGSGVGAPAFGANCGVVPCSCGDTVVASRTLVCGVDPVTTTICPGAGLIVARLLPADPPVDLNLGFCTITGDGVGADVGILIADDDVVVRSGRITGFLAGVATPAIASTDSSTLTGLNIYDNGTGIFLLASNTTVKNNLVRLNDENGLSVFGGMGPGNNTVSANRSEENGGEGVAVQGIMCTVIGNFSQRNGGDGFDINCSQAATVKQNRAKYNELEGFKLQGSGHSVSLNEAHMNGTDGFTVLATMSRFDRNRSDYNGDFGIRDTTIGGGTSMTANTYVNNRCTGNDDGKSSPPGLCQ